jgi:hypothetical protein
VFSIGTQRQVAAVAAIYMATVSGRLVRCVDLGEMAFERTVRVYSKARQSLATITAFIVDCLAYGRIEKLLMHGDVKTGH